MIKALFLVCTECHLESFILRHDGDHACLLLSLGTLLFFRQMDNAEELTDIILDKAISRTVLVADASCCFSIHLYAERMT